jgi:hypothetical protein
VASRRGQWAVGGKDTSRKVSWKKPRKRGGNEFCPSVLGRISLGLGHHLLGGDRVMVWRSCVFSGIMGFPFGGILSDRAVLLFRGWG